MCNHKRTIGIILVALFFALPLLTTPVYADDTIEEPGTGAGGEWSGEIIDPTPAPAPAPTPAPTPTPEPEPIPAPAAPKTTPKTTPVATPAVVEETPVEEAPVEEAPVEETKEEIKAEEPKEETPEVPAALTPSNEPESDESIRTKIIALIFTVVIFFIGLLIWASNRLYRIVKFERIYKEAVKKSRNVKINRAG